jgi:hypothetical protein
MCRSSTADQLLITSLQQQRQQIKRRQDHSPLITTLCFLQTHKYTAVIRNGQLLQTCLLLTKIKKS